MDKKYLWALDTIWEDSEVVNCTTKIYLKRECKNGTFEVTTDVMQAAMLTMSQMKEITGNDWQLFADQEIYDPGVTGSIGNVGRKGQAPSFNSLQELLDSDLSENERKALINELNKQVKSNKEHYHVLKVKGVDIEPFDIIDAMAEHVDPRIKWYTDNIIKYGLRFPFKLGGADMIKDLEKIRDYANEALIRLEGGRD